MCWFVESDFYRSWELIYLLDRSICCHCQVSASKIKSHIFHSQTCHSLDFLAWYHLPFFFTWIKALGNINLEQINVTAFSQIDIVNKTKDSPTALHHSWNVTDMMQEAWYQLCKEGQTTQSSHMVYGWSLNAASMTFSWKAPICLWNVFRQSEAKKK